MSNTHLVTGGTGTLGRALVARLGTTGGDVRILSRRPGPGHVVGDLRTGEGIDQAVAGADVVLHAATGARGDADLTRTLIDATRRTGEDPHLIYISIVGINRIPLSYYRSKLASEALIEASGLRWTILRATQFHDLIAGMSRTLSHSPVFPVLASTRFQPIDVRDVSERLVELAGGPARQHVPDIGGPEVRSMGELATTWLAAADKRRPVLSITAPGRTAKAFRQGWNITPDHRDGRITFDEYLSERIHAGRS